MGEHHQRVPAGRGGSPDGGGEGAVGGDRSPAGDRGAAVVDQRQHLVLHGQRGARRPRRRRARLGGGGLGRRDRDGGRREPHGRGVGDRGGRRIRRSGGCRAPAGGEEQSRRGAGDHEHGRSWVSPWCARSGHDVLLGPAPADGTGGAWVRVWSRGGRSRRQAVVERGIGGPGRRPPVGVGGVPTVACAGTEAGMVRSWGPTLAAAPCSQHWSTSPSTRRRSRAFARCRR